ncbi:INTRADIOL-DIOXYGENAS domain-containing protein [Fusarium sp. LHS14.1]|nr:INTRADIOL-DIOXYGENAS domain-containing protein [Fusarium sp. LHS14.1]
MARLTSLLAVGLGLCSSVMSHPGEAHDPKHMAREIHARNNMAAIGRRSMESCSGSAAAQALKARSIERRTSRVRALRAKRGITSPSKKYRRDTDDLTSWEDVNHNMTGSVSYDMFTPLADIFDANSSCILSPEITAGPYYVVGEFLRSNVIESEYCDGVPLFLEVQYVDVASCQPVPVAAVDIWNANATGVYSGISVSGNEAEGGVNSTYLRGVQITDHDGVVQFETIFPGHYQGRATHTHLLTHTNATVMPNGTISVWDAPVSHIGQLFWPETLRSAVEATYPYNTNTQDVTSNEEDMWSVLQADASFDPFPQYVYLGDKVEDGIFAWIQIGVNASVDYSTDDYYGVAGYLGEDGGHALDSGIGGGGEGGEGGGAGGPPSGAQSGMMPTGTMAPSS